MYSKSAELYDQIYSFKDYAQEARQIETLIKAHRPDATAILDVACGTGEHARYLSSTFSVDGIDLQPELIDIATRKLKVQTSGHPIGLRCCVRKTPMVAGSLRVAP